MKKYLCYFSVILLLGIGTLPVISDINSYNVHEDDKSGNSIKINSDEKILFIVDFSNSMNDYLGSRKKIDVAISSLSTIAIKSIDKNRTSSLRTQTRFQPVSWLHGDKFNQPDNAK